MRRHRDAWPRHRDASFATGSAVPACALTDTLPGGPFTAHMTQHLTVAIAAPLLLILAALRP